MSVCVFMDSILWLHEQNSIPISPRILVLLPWGLPPEIDLVILRHMYPTGRTWELVNKRKLQFVLKSYTETEGPEILLRENSSTEKWCCLSPVQCLFIFVEAFWYYSQATYGYSPDIFKPHAKPIGRTIKKLVWCLSVRPSSICSLLDRPLLRWDVEDQGLQFIQAWLTDKMSGPMSQNNHLIGIPGCLVLFKDRDWRS